MGLLQPFCHREGSHLERETYIDNAWKGHRRI